MSNEKEKNSERPYLYLISPEVIEDVDAFAKLLDAALEGPTVASFQLRLKNVEDDVIINTAQKLMPITIKHDVAFIINDRMDIAKTVDADGVHLGQSDGDPKEARALLGFDKAIGVTCHDSIDLAFIAGEKGADYVAFGAFYETNTHPTKYRPEPEIIDHWITATELACVAIGGINPTNAKPLIDQGAHFIAVCSYVWDHKQGPAAAVAEFEEVFTK